MTQTQPSNATQQSPVYVSRHFELRPGEAEAYMHQRGWQLKPATDGNICVRECHWCPPHKGQQSNLWKLYVRQDSGAFHCVRCKTSGSWLEMRRKLGDVPEITDIRGNSLARRQFRTPNQTVARMYADQRPIVGDEVNDWLKGRGLTEETLGAYQVGFGIFTFQGDDGDFSTPCVTFPWLQQALDGNLFASRIKARALCDKGYMRLDPAGGAWGWFGLHLVPADAKEVVITEGELDAMSVYQATGMPAISLPNGSNSLPPDLLPALERFERIILWLDDDAPGRESIEAFAEKLGRKRVSVVRQRTQAEPATSARPPRSKDANEALTAGHDLKAHVLAAESLQHQSIATFDDLRADVYRELSNPEQLKGVPCDSLPGLNGILKGHRRGELTILTGPTGRGKTTILSQISTDYAMRGVSTLWGSFEIKNVRLAKKMLGQYACINLEQHLDKFDYWADKFSLLPIYFMKFFGSTQVEDILDACEYAVYAQDVGHIVLDNLQFMTSGQAKSFDVFDLQDAAIKALRDFASQRNVHITLVIHPRKQSQDDTLLSLSDVFGRGKATQESDNVIILQALAETRFLEVKKNRFDGDLGRVYYTYDKATGRIRELTPGEMADTTAPAQMGPPEQRRRGGGSMKSMLQSAAGVAMRHPQSE